MTSELFLVDPNIKYMETFQSMTNEYLSSGEVDYFNLYKDSLLHFDKYIQTLDNYSKGLNLPIGWTAGYTFWLTDPSNKIFGVLRLRKQPSPLNGHIGFDIVPSKRHKGLGNVILKLGLKKAKEYGLRQVLLTCDSDNIASKKIIENNGGLFESELFDENNNKTILRYWVTL